MFHLILTINNDSFPLYQQRSVRTLLFGVKRVVSIVTILRQVLTFALRVTSHLVVSRGPVPHAVARKRIVILRGW